MENIITGSTPKKKDQEHNIPQENKSNIDKAGINTSNLFSSMKSHEYNNLKNLSQSFRTTSYNMNVYNFSYMMPFSMSLTQFQYMTSKNTNYDFDMLMQFCSTKPSDFFNGIEQADILWNLFNDVSKFELKELAQLLFNNSISNIYGKRRLAKITYLKNSLSYIVKGFPKHQFKYALKEMIFYQENIKNNTNREDIFGIQHGCLMDNEYIYILMEKDKNYQTLSDGNVYNELRNADFATKIRVLINIANAINEVHNIGYYHNMISPDSFLFDSIDQTLKLIHFENLTIINIPHTENFKSLRGTVYKSDLKKKMKINYLGIKNSVLINYDLYALVKLMLHLDGYYFESRLDLEGFEKYDTLFKAEFDSITELYQLDSYSTVESLLDYIQAKVKDNDDDKKKMYNPSLINKIVQSVFGKEEEKNQLENKQEEEHQEGLKENSNIELNQIYEDILKIDSPKHIKNANELIYRLTILQKYDIATTKSIPALSNLGKRYNQAKNGGLLKV